MNCYYNKVLYLLFLIIFSSCSSWIENDQPQTDQERNFEIFWNNVNNTYPLFEYDHLDWDSMHSQYYTHVQKGIDDQELFDIFVAMLRPMSDGHLSISSPSGSFWKNEGYLKYTSYFSLETITHSYLRDTIEAEWLHTSSGNKLLLQHGKIDKDILYLYIPSFNNDASFVSLLNALISKENPSAVIIDLRDNFGGDVYYLKNFLDFFSNEERVYGYYKVKLGPLRDNFSLPHPQVFGNNATPFEKPIALLTNRFTYSAAERAVLALKELANVQVLGDTTGGALGLTVQRKLPNQMEWVMVDGLMMDLNSKIYEGIGIAPDFPVKVSSQDLEKGKDPVIEQALLLLKK